MIKLKSSKNITYVNFDHLTMEKDLSNKKRIFHGAIKICKNIYFHELFDCF